MALGDDVHFHDRMSIISDILEQEAEAEHKMRISRSENKLTETTQPQSPDTSPPGERSTCINNETTSLHHETVNTHFQPPARSEMKITRKMIARVDKCSGCQKTSLPNQACSCPYGHMLCHFCVQNEVQEMLLGNKKTRKVKCSISYCERYLSDEELCKVLPPFTIQLIERKVDQDDKEYVQYIKNWFLTSYSTKLQTREEFAISSLPAVEESKEIWPLCWIPMRKGQPTTVYKVTQGSDEYAAQANAFHKSLTFPDYEIVALYRIQNPILWKFYSLKRSQMMAENDNSEVCEEKLFHGTVQKAVGIIAEKGFDWRLCGKNATVYGKGTYFAKSAFVSHPYTFSEKCSRCESCAQGQAAQTLQPHQAPRSFTHQTEDIASAFVRDPSSNTHFMFAAHVLVGQFTRGRASFRRPPPVDKDQPFGKLYDSCVDHVRDPERFVVFDHTQAYPMYVLEYTAPKKSNTS